MIDSHSRILYVNTQACDYSLPYCIGPWPMVGWFEQLAGLQVGEMARVDAILEILPGLDGVQAVFVGGSTSHSVTENLKWQRELIEWIGTVLDKKIPFFGVGLGAQAALFSQGGKINKDPNGGEFGFTTVTLTSEGKRNRLLEGLIDQFNLYTSHTYSVELPIPQKMKLLATNREHPVQIVALNENAFAIQAHPDFPSDFIELATKNSKESLKKKGIIGNEKEAMDRFISQMESQRQIIKDNSKRLFRNFMTGPVADSVKK